MHPFNLKSDNIVPRHLAVAMIFGLLIASLHTANAVAADSEDDDSSHNWRFHGRLQIDSAQYDSNNPLFLDDTAVRRGRVALLGDLWAGWRMKLEYEFSGSTPGPKGIYLRHDLGKEGALTLGHFKESLSLQTSTSSRYNTFMERALQNADSLGYRLGAKFTTHGETWSATTGLTSGGLDDNHNVESDGVGFYARGVFNPATSKKRLWHFGLSSEIRNYDTTDSIRLRARPESDLTDIRMIDTTTIADLDQSRRFGAEFAWKRKELHMQAEYQSLNTTRTTGVDLDFSGWYAQMGWFITGETRKYNRDTGSFGRTKPKKSHGAWEVAIRYSELDLNNAEITGGLETNTAYALNWYATDDVRVSLNYIDASARPNSLGVDDDVSIIQARFQYIF